MAYTLNSAKDAKGDEHLYVELFTKNRAAIEQYKRQHGGDLEHAFQAVTGTPWPEGRSVKIHDGVPEMTKDRTVKSVLGKYVAPIAGAVAAPFILPALLGGGGAAAGAAGGGSAAGGAAAGGAAAGGAAAGGTAAAVGGGIAAAAPSLWKSLLPAGIAAGGALASSYLQSKGVNDAAKEQADATEKALALQKQMYEQDRADMEPYRQLGAGAVGSLGYLGGLSGFEQGTAPRPAAPTSQAAPAMSDENTLRGLLLQQLQSKSGGSGVLGMMIPGLMSQVANAPDSAFTSMVPGAQSRAMSRTGSSLATLGGQVPGMQPGAEQMVTLRAPSGQTKQVPQSQAQKYLQAGAQVVS